MTFFLRALVIITLLLLSFAILQRNSGQPQKYHKPPRPIKNSFAAVSTGGCGDGNGANTDADNGCYGDEEEKSDYENEYRGRWELASEDSRVSAMHMFLFPNTNKAFMLDAVALGPSNSRLPPGIYRRLPGNRKKYMDLWAHVAEYDNDVFAIRPLNILTDTWSSSGGISANGSVMISGGWGGGGKTVRFLSGCHDKCTWMERRKALSVKRWYSTQQLLPDGRFIVVGGRGMFSYEYITMGRESNRQIYELPFLQETADSVENNLYPFVFLASNGNLFIFANNRSILLNLTSNEIVRELPVLPGGSRNYPASAMSALLPIKLHDPNPDVIRNEVLICGGAKSEAANLAGKGVFIDALDDCARIDIMDPKARWQKEIMPSPRVVGDMLLLPTGDVLILNGAKKGAAGWNFADDPNTTPILYEPDNPVNERFSELTATTRPRMCHSTSVLLPDGQILVAGSNPNYRYNSTDPKRQRELRIEKFYPPYLERSLNSDRPSIVSSFKEKMVKYGEIFVIEFKLKKSKVRPADLKVTMYAPPFTTHGFSMGQRLLVLAIKELNNLGSESFQVSVMAPPRDTVAPPSYYLVFVLHGEAPSPGVWVKLG